VIGAIAAACSSSGTGTGGGAQADGGVNDAAPSGDAAGVPPGGAVTPPTTTGNAVVDRLGRAAAACGRQSSFTVPGGWQNVAVGDKGCMVWAPPGWLVTGAGSSTTSVFSDDTGVEGFVGIAGATRDVKECTPAELRTGILGGFAQNGYASPQVLWHVEGNEDFGGTSWANGHAVFGTSRGGTSLVGYLWVLATPTVIACDVVGLGFWEPVDRIEADTCTVSQILNSVTCPRGGGCDPVECDQSCKAEGRTGGSCNSGCECH